MQPCKVSWTPTDRTDLPRVLREREGSGVLIAITMGHEPMGVVIENHKFILLPLSMLTYGGH